MAKIIAIRHAESIANKKGIYQGQTYDTGLSALGKKQARALAKTFKGSTLHGVKIDKIITSPLQRTKQTSEIISKVFDLPVVEKDEIIETNHGVWEGKKKTWIEAKYTSVYKKWQTHPGEVYFPAGEHFIETVKRVEKFVLRNEWKGTNLVVTHDNVVRILICLAERRAINDLWKFDIQPTALNIFEIKGINGKKELSLIEKNNTEHLNGLKASFAAHAL